MHLCWGRIRGSGCTDVVSEIAVSQRDLLSKCGTAPAGLRRFIATTASMRSFFGCVRKYSILETQEESEPLGTVREPLTISSAGHFYGLL